VRAIDGHRAVAKILSAFPGLAARPGTPPHALAPPHSCYQADMRMLVGNRAQGRRSHQFAHGVAVALGLVSSVGCEVDGSGLDFGEKSGAGRGGGGEPAIPGAGGQSPSAGGLVGNGGSSGAAAGAGASASVQPINPCSAVPCKNGGVCQPTEKGFSCFCPTGFSGATCQTEDDQPRSPNDTDDCNPNPCAHAGDCEDLGDGFKCDCVDGYDGDTCEEDIDDCAGEPCQNGSECSDRVAAYVCECAAGFSGNDCERAVSGCEDDPCLNGTCVDTADSYECSCVDGFDGNNCENNIDECEGDPCQNGGACTDGVAQYTCQCSSGFEGPTCDTDIDECEGGAGPCKNGGTCTNQPGSYRCSCPTGWSGPTCENDVNECSSAGACAPGQTCRNFPGTFGCPCPAGYAGADCELKTFEWLTPHSSDWTYCQALDVSDDGLVAVGGCMTSTGTRAFRWTPTEGMQSLGTLGDTSAAHAVSGDGKVIVGQLTRGEQPHSFRWTAQGQMQEFEALAGEIGGYANDTNGDGSVIVGKSDQSDGRELAYRWTASSRSNLGYTGTWRTVAESVTEDGATVVGWGAEIGAWKWTSATGLVALPASPSGGARNPRDISPNGSLIAGSGYANSADFLILWQGSSVSEIPGIDSPIAQISNNGVIAAANYLWSVQTGTRATNAALTASGADCGCLRVYALNVSADGQTLVGSALSDGAWIARLPNGLK
jgi:probable HAF family extracellular repeat protein